MAAFSIPGSRIRTKSVTQYPLSMITAVETLQVFIAIAIRMGG